MINTSRKPPQKQNGDASQLQDFAYEIGSTKGTDPIPPDQYLSYQDKRYPPTIRLWAWMLAHTIRHGHRKAWAVGPGGNELHLSHAAADLDMDDGNIRRAWRQLELEKRVWRDGRKLRISGVVTLPKLRICPAAKPETDPGPVPEETGGKPQVGENKKRSEVCTDLLKPYILLKLNTLSKSVRITVEDEYTREDLAEKRCIAEATAAARSIFGKRKDNILLVVGIKVIREVKPPDAPAADENQLRLVFEKAINPLVPDLVTGSVQTGSAQTSKPHLPGLHKVKNDVVQTAQKSAEKVLTPTDGAASTVGTERAFSEIQRSSLVKPIPSSSSAVPLMAQPRAKAEEEDKDLYQQFKEKYPAAHFDEPKAKPSFDKQTKTQQRQIIDRLHVYLSCERWQDQEGKWIPLASTWLKTCEAEPPPKLNIRNGGGLKIAGEDPLLKQMREDRERRAAWQTD